ncbi:bark storage protein A-like isoform X3 [Prosopis cineraria]|uniref:bark storage protein A-like isoform X3 n=1 Tax=Prosopis cineraria TaxID=364024 RepID=UPI0024102287|nr:bark storage protein A-like isoform X3 [Prosopis cineraria]XP_054812825.1 bark storage protein A-like isoform X3 [Prosopis cineraria]
MGTRILVILLLSLTAEFAVSLCRSKAVQVMKELKLKGPYFGIIAAYPPEEIAFFASKAFKPDPKHPFVELSGRLYWVGKIFDKKVIFVRCGVGMLNAAAVTQQMIDVFDVIGILHFGIAGSANDSISFGDVTIPKQFIHTGLWDWLKPNGTLESSDFARLDFGNFNVPKGKNLLGRVGYSSEEFFSVTGKPNLSQRLIWAKVTSQWLQLAATLETCLSNGFPVIVIRGISDMAGKNGDEAIDTFGALAATNAVTVLLHLLKILPSSHHHYISLLNS